MFSIFLFAFMTVTGSLVTQSAYADTKPIETNKANLTLSPSVSSDVTKMSWQWPAKGNIIEKFSKTSKGIDISGSLGDKIVAAADGSIVYCGDALPG